MKGLGHVGVDYVQRTVVIGIDGGGVAGTRWVRVPRGMANAASVGGISLALATLYSADGNQAEIAGATSTGAALSAASLGAILGSSIGKFIETDSPFESIGIGTLLATIGLNIGQQIELSGRHVTDGSGNPIRAFDDFGHDLVGVGVGALSSYLVSELVNDIGLDGFVGGVVSSAGGAAVSQIANNLLNGVAWNTNLLTSVVNAVAGFVGYYLASQLVEFDTIEGQIGASVGTTIGAYVGSLFGPIGTAVGAFIGYIVGGLIGSLFGGKAKAAADLGWNERDQRFSVTSSWSKNRGNRQGAVSMGNTVANIFNSVIDETGAHLLDGWGVRRGAYGHIKSQWVYYATGGPGAGSITYGSGNVDDVITHGAYLGLSDMVSRLMGGDVYAKRALAATIDQAGGNPASNYQGAAGAFSTEALLGNFAIAKDYAAYLHNSAAINALIAAEPTSAFTAGWTITFARVMELGLDKRGRTDWIGGWNAFLDETRDGAIDGAAFAPGNLVLELDPEIHERLFVFVDQEGELLGVLGDTIDTASKDVITGTSGNDTLTVNGDAIALSSANDNAPLSRAA